MILDKDLSAVKLAGEVDKILDNEELLKQMSYRAKLLSNRNSAEMIVDGIEKLL